MGRKKARPTTTHDDAEVKNEADLCVAVSATGHFDINAFFGLEWVKAKFSFPSFFIASIFFKIWWGTSATRNHGSKKK